MKSRTLSKSDIKEINKELLERFGIEPLSKKDSVKEIDDEITYVEVNGDIMFFYSDEVLLPTLKSLLVENFLKTITVDMGAVKFVASGADVMRPGIVEVSEGISPGDVVSIIDINNKKPLAIGEALFSSEEMKEQKSGKSIKSIHYIGDSIWKLG